METLLLILAAWCALSLPLGVLVGRAISGKQRVPVAVRLVRPVTPAQPIAPQAGAVVGF